MDKNRWTTQKFRVLGSHNINVETEFVSGDYELVLEEAVRTTETGLLEVLRILPKRAGLPSFSGRWDQGDDRVDIDLQGDDSEARSFATQKLGYLGHKAKRLDVEGRRVYRVEVETPSAGLVFKGTVALNVDLGLMLEGGFNLTAAVEVKAEVIRNGRVVEGDE